jgi:hypothetical protein
LFGLAKTLQEPGDVCDGENPVTPGAAEAFQPADQVSGRNMPRDRFAMQGDQGRELGNADGRAAGKGGLERARELARIRGKCAHAASPVCCGASCK